MSPNLFEQLQSLLPPVSYDPSGTVLSAQMTAEANALQAALTQLEGVEAAIFPESAGTYISDWERVYAITPAPGATQDQRVQVVLAAMADMGGQSIPYFIALARRLGITATVDVNRPALTQIASVGDPVPDGDKLTEWRVNAPLSAYRTASLESLIQIRRPANTEVTVGYGKAVAVRLATTADRLFNSAQYVIPESING
ncbi:DUF2313 domain-containing protein [Pseudomonas alloputida]|uniref:DUF2313 domain-containing protein n=1 Tax=Pseudomonas alloputida TaxID=1940621 RepID=A0AAW7HGP4_9PSED|nr:MULTISPECIES: putative phage tail protein [Pseudomonas]MBP2843732.1 DUF2313 domain-containing protein [Pseudomonas sp. PNP]MCE0864070.1 DUF2313 domain-containing protein [Pseudomonas alloputida]MCE0869947.1 DUF2313 domain-containing protein [Pseudomonas alloputida]MCE0893047.1 DUF2313 domain-containing protein [Pseudomonas alloputida]MCE0922238.1 DUF2313 domain-containing protein [Pseudomonas alloputida]